MKRLLLSIVAIIFLNVSMQAQAPGGFNYQAVARDDNGQPLVNQEIGIQIQLLKDSPEGAVVYEELFFPETDAHGLIQLIIGTGDTRTGDFSAIDWGAATYYIEVAMDADGGQQFQTMGTSQLMSVPYALHSLTAADTFSGDYGDLENAPDLSQYIAIEGAQEGDLLFYQEDAWARLPIGEENQALLVKNGLPQWVSVSFGDTDLFPPALEITSTTGVTASQIIVHAEITDDGGAHVTERGFVWGEEENPGFDDEVAEAGAGAGTYSTTFEDLEESTTYYFRAFATNGIGTTFSDQLAVTTLSESDTTGTVTDVDGNVYETKLINDLWWMTENLTTRKYRDGSDIAYGYDEDEWTDITHGAWAYFNDDPQWEPIYGRLYNWYAVADERGLCPEGWRMPTDQEVQDLRDHFGGFSVAGGPLKETGTAEDGDGYWREPNEGATNISGFSARPGGARIHGVFFNRETTGYFWTGDEHDDPDFARNFLYTYDEAHMLRHIYRKHYGLSVRCVKD